jgi:hypothetical protein
MGPCVCCLQESVPADSPAANNIQLAGRLLLIMFIIFSEQTETTRKAITRVLATDVGHTAERCHSQNPLYLGTFSMPPQRQILFEQAESGLGTGCFGHERPTAISFRITHYGPMPSQALTNNAILARGEQNTIVIDLNMIVPRFPRFLIHN